ncbi:shikimate dehydrogenase [Georgenia sp. TF02-10]|uniref:shikimate dehydrogenase n=1 Tax=Georgenia sp. TF02-10 TaxID=2917725 RepID=UPI001FA7A2B9|nr:shikimate dehydrogenase [Georgenia sp. TF02-10]UNX53244.1 shikimate dehydrogenase [Georgenia sp. TF02-10]
MSRTGEPAPAGVAATGEDLTAPGITHRAAVLGHPVAHSLSPALHRAAYDALGLTGWGYGLQDVTAAELPAVLAQLDASWAGLSLTMPLKQAVLPHLDVLDPLAEVTGVVNTVVVQPGRAGAAGPLVGFNTDIHGIVAALREGAGPGWTPRRAAVLGARATATSALAALTELGAASTDLVARSVAGPGSAAAAAHRMGVAVRHVPWASAQTAAAALAGADVVVSTVPAGVADDVAAALTEALAGGEAAAADRAGPLTGRVLLDVVYDPWPTPLATAWQAAGGTVVPGWAMLVHQAEAQVRLMTGRSPDVAAMRAALLAERARRAAGGAVPPAPPPFPAVRQG